MKNKKPRTTTIVGCARCGGTHKDIVLRKITSPYFAFTHFTTCPKLDEPILIFLVDDEKCNKPTKIIKHRNGV